MFRNNGAGAAKPPQTPGMAIPSGLSMMLSKLGFDPQVVLGQIAAIAMEVGAARRELAENLGAIRQGQTEAAAIGSVRELERKTENAAVLAAIDRVIDKLNLTDRRVIDLSNRVDAMEAALCQKQPKKQRR